MRNMDTLIERDTYTPSALRRARKQALEAAKRGVAGSEHCVHYDDVVYVRTAKTVVRLDKTDAGRTIAERIVWRAR